MVEDNGRVGGVGDAVARVLRDSGVGVPLRTFGIPQRFLDHAKRPQILADAGLTPADIADVLVGSLGLGAGVAASLVG